MEHAAISPSVSTITHLLADEQARLAELDSFHILDTLPEEAYERITRLAKILLDCPTSLVSLIAANRQWFKSNVGISVPEIPRSWAFCSHTIEQNRVMVVPDATKDPRFADNPLVVGEPFIRFYAGAPIITPRGYALGAVCVIAPEPREDFSEQDQIRLAELAGIVANELELRLQLDRATKLAKRNQSLLLQVHKRVGSSLQLVSDALQVLVVNHRIRKSLAVVGTAIGDHSRGEDHPELLPALQYVTTRIGTIAAVHQQLLVSDESGMADARDFIVRLQQDMWPGLIPECHGREIIVNSGPMLVPADLLPRLALIATELVANAHKRGPGAVTLELQPKGAGVTLTVGQEEGNANDKPDPCCANKLVRSLTLRMVEGSSDVHTNVNDRRTVVVDVFP